MKAGKYTEALSFLDKVILKEASQWTLYQLRLIYDGILNRGKTISNHLY